MSHELICLLLDVIPKLRSHTGRIKRQVSLDNKHFTWADYYEVMLNIAALNLETGWDAEFAHFIIDDIIRRCGLRNLNVPPYNSS